MRLCCGMRPAGRRRPPSKGSWRSIRWRFRRMGPSWPVGVQDGTVVLWEVTSGQEKATLQGNTDWARSVAFSPDGTTLASGGSRDGTVVLWDVASGQETATLQGHIYVVYSVAFSPDGATLASGSRDGTVVLWEVASGQETATLRHTTGLTSVAFSPDGTTLASVSYDETVRLWDVASGQEKATLRGHTSWVRSVAFSPDGTTLASGSWDNTVGTYIEYCAKTDEKYKVRCIPRKDITLGTPSRNRLRDGMAGGVIRHLTVFFQPTARSFSTVLGNSVSPSLDTTSA